MGLSMQEGPDPVLKGSVPAGICVPQPGRSQTPAGFRLSRTGSGEVWVCAPPAEFWSQILMVLSWEDVATRTVPSASAGRNTQQAVVCWWPLYSTTLQPGCRRSQSWEHTTGSENSPLIAELVPQQAR